MKNTNKKMNILCALVALATATLALGIPSVDAASRAPQGSVRRCACHTSNPTSVRWLRRNMNPGVRLVSRSRTAQSSGLDHCPMRPSRQEVVVTMAVRG